MSCHENCEESRQSAIRHSRKKVNLKGRETIGALSLFSRYGENSGDSTHAEPHFPTSWHYQISSVKSIAFRNKIERKARTSQRSHTLTWAQEARGSNPRVPTISFAKYISFDSRSSSSPRNSSRRNCATTRRISSYKNSGGRNSFRGAIFSMPSRSHAFSICFCFS